MRTLWPLFLLGLLSGCASGISLVFSEQEIENELSGAFPVGYTHPVGVVQLESPDVILEKGTDRITFDITVSVAASGLPPIKSRVRVSALLFYDRDDGGLYLLRPKVVKIDSALPMPGKVKKQVTKALDFILPGVLSNAAVARVPEDKRVLRFFLRSVSVRDGDVTVTLGR